MGDQGLVYKLEMAPGNAAFSPSQRGPGQTFFLHQNESHKCCKNAAAPSRSPQNCPQPRCASACFSGLWKPLSWWWFSTANSRGNHGRNSASCRPSPGARRSPRRRRLLQGLEGGAWGLPPEGRGESGPSWIWDDPGEARQGQRREVTAEEGRRRAGCFLGAACHPGPGVQAP